MRIFLTPCWTFTLKRHIGTLSFIMLLEEVMAHKKIERKKELARRRHRRAERLKQRVREAKAAKA